MVYQEVEKDVNKVVDEDNVVDKKLNEGSQLEDMVMMNVFMTKSRMLYNSESNGGPFSKVVFKS